jgi:hypothetical protein
MRKEFCMRLLRIGREAGERQLAPLQNITEYIFYYVSVEVIEINGESAIAEIGCPMKYQKIHCC